MTPYEEQSLARLVELSANVAELATWVVVAGLGTGICAGLLIWQVIMYAKNEGRFW